MSQVTNRIRNFVFIYFGLFLVYSYVQFEYKISDSNSYLIVASITSLIISNIILQLMFRPTKIKGLDRTYVVGPDLGIIREEKIQAKRVLPDEAPCEFCKKTVYKPFICVNCKKLFCGQHMLPLDHDCPNK